VNCGVVPHPMRKRELTNNEAIMIRFIGEKEKNKVA
jgi:hypothetical protein